MTRCIFCSSTSGVGQWRIKGTSLRVCERCAASRRKYVEAVKEKREAVRT